jgi:hypothetical protein
VKKATKTPVIKEENKEVSIQEIHEYEQKEPEESKSSEESKRNIHPKKMQQMESDSEMNCEGGQQEEEEQSESSEEDKSEAEGEESEVDSQGNEIRFERGKTKITMKDIDKEFWRVINTYRSEINQLQLDHNHIRDSIKEHCKNVADDSAQQIKNLEKKIELDFKEQLIYIKTLQSDIETSTKKFKRERTDFTLETGNLNKRIDDMEAHQEYVMTSIKTLAALSK